MARYPTLPFVINSNNIEDAYSTVRNWASALVNDLDTRDVQVDTKPSTNIYTVTTVTEIGRPKKGDIAYSVSSGKFKGYVSSGSTTEWQNLN